MVVPSDLRFLQNIDRPMARADPVDVHELAGSALVQRRTCRWAPRLQGDSRYRTSSTSLYHLIRSPIRLRSLQRT